jgi:2,4-dienoyl-CoA reductase (NADPH2)
VIGKRGFHKLLEPYHIGRVQIKNRMVKTGAGTGWCEGNHITEKTKHCYEALARGGIGLINTECCTVDYPLGLLEEEYVPGKSGGGLFRFDDDSFIPDFRELTEVIHRHGCPTVIQLYHAGPWHPPETPELQLVSASTMSGSEIAFDGETSAKGLRGLTIAEIEEYTDKFGAAAVRAEKAGFDGVEINASAGHLVNSFLSRVMNKRQDDYGCQSLENRSRFLVEIIQEIKKRLGQDFPVTALINGAELGIDKGTTIEETQGIAQILEAAGADGIHVRGYGFGDFSFTNILWPENIFYPEPPKFLPKVIDGSHNGAGAVVPMAAALKEVVSIPIITVGRINPILGEKILQQGKADFIGFTRALMADPDLPNKVAEGRLEDIAPCIAGMEGCGEPNNIQTCTVNAAWGSDQDYVIKPAEKKKKVVVVGGGPAGMEAARVAAMRGHEVTLYERESKLGGLLPLAALVKGFEIEDLTPLIRYLSTQITKLGVKINLGKEANPSLIKEIKPDVVILATGGVPTTPEIAGINRRNVVSGPDLYRRLKAYLRFLGPKALRWLSKFWMPVGKNVVIIGGAMRGCELAEFLVKRGRKVTIVDTNTAETLGQGIVSQWKRGSLLDWLAKKGVTMVTEVKYEEITDKGLVVKNKEGKSQTILADTIVIATPLKPDTELLKTLKGEVPEIYAIGDCSEPRLILEAIGGGYRVARNL